MLVLTRKLNECIQIGDDIEVKVISVDGEQVKIGIEAPKHVDIHRKEIYLGVERENSEAAAKGDLSALTELTKQLHKP